MGGVGGWVDGLYGEQEGRYHGVHGDGQGGEGEGGGGAGGGDGHQGHGGPQVTHCCSSDLGNPKSNQAFHYKIQTDS